MSDQWSSRQTVCGMIREWRKVKGKSKFFATGRLNLSSLLQVEIGDQTMMNSLIIVELIICRGRIAFEASFPDRIYQTSLR